MKRYEECIFEGHSPCPSCSLTSRGLDCHNLPAEPVAYLRHCTGMRQGEFAATVGIKQQQWQAYEYGKNSIANMRLSTAVKVARALGITADELYAFCRAREE